MGLTSVHFVVFFIITVLIYFALPQRWRWILLLAASYYFYMCSKPAYAAIMLATTCVSYFSALLMEKRDTKEARRPYLLIGLFANLGILFTFKYLGFFLDPAGEVLARFNVISSIPHLNWIAPLGISFYTLQTLSYLFDVYSGKIHAERHFGYLATYVSLFLTVSSGPIERGAHLIPQLHEKHDFSYEKVTYGLKLIAWGLFKKLVIAERLALLVNQVYDNVRLYRGLILLVATFFFAIQLYADFSGYTDIVRGCGKVMGFDLLENFNLPYFARSIQDFWRRWHMSMTSWFRDYLYIPLGGNRKGKLRTYLNIFVVFLVSGLWHGANWTFVVWGALHGVYQMTGRATSGAREKLWRLSRINPEGRIASVIKAVVTFILVDFAWIFFRAGSLGEAGYVITKMFSSQQVYKDAGQSMVGIVFDCMLILILLVLELLELRRPLIERVSCKPVLVRWFVYCTIVLVILLFGVMGSRQFIYMRF